MNIKDASRASGLPAKTIRHYEDLGLVTPARSANGYRQFSDRDVTRLGFVARARSLGFSLADCRALLDLQDDPHRASADVKRIAEGHRDAIAARIEALLAMRDTLGQMIAACPGDSGAACAILSGIAPGQALKLGP